MRLNQILGIAMIVIGILIAIFGVAVAPQSMVSIGPVTIGGIPPLSAASIGVGAILVIVGAFVFFGKAPELS
jgi:uncharacterized membrane protein